MWFRPTNNSRVITYPQKTIDAAIKADLNARRYVMIEELKKATDIKDYIEIIDQLDAIEHRIECIKIRKQLHNNRFAKDSLTHRWNRAAKQFTTSMKVLN